MRILGIDPGIAIVGWGVIDYERMKAKPVDYGAITTNDALAQNPLHGVREEGHNINPHALTSLQSDGR